MADPARIASPIAPGIGFLGAGAIIQLRGSVLGLTTGATIWAVAAVGVVVGSGYVAAGLLFTTIIFVTLSLFRRLETLIGGPCVFGPVRIRYRVNNGKGRVRIQAALDAYQIPDEDVSDTGTEKEGDHTFSLKYCSRHHRSILNELADIEEVVALET